MGWMEDGLNSWADLQLVYSVGITDHKVSGVAREGVLLYYISIIMNDDDVVGSFVRRMSAEEEVVLDMWAIIKLLTGHGSSPR